MATESSAYEVLTQGISEAELTLEGGGCRVTVRGPERDGDPTRWADALMSAFEVWAEMERVAHASRIREIKAEQSAPPGPASAGFTQERAS